MINNKMRQHIDLLVNYDFSDEEKNYEENDRPAGHIYESLKAVSEWLKGAYSEEEMIALIESKISYEESLDQVFDVNIPHKKAYLLGMNHVLDIFRNPGAYDDSTN